MTVSQPNQRRCGNTHRRLRLELCWAGLSLAVLPPRERHFPHPRLFCSRCSRGVGSFSVRPSVATGKGRQPAPAEDMVLYAAKPTRCALVVRLGTSLSRGSSVTPDSPSLEPRHWRRTRTSGSCGHPHFSRPPPSRVCLGRFRGCGGGAGSFLDPVTVEE